MRVGIFQSRDTGLAHGSAQDALAVTAVDDASIAIREACRRLGWTPVDVEAALDPRRTLANLDAARTDVVFHLAESIGGEARLEAAAAWLLEWARVPYTGSSPVALTLALEKPRARAVLAAAGVPLPAGFLLERADEPLPEVHASTRGPWIVKPAREDASHGIELESVVHDERTLRTRAEHVIRTYRQGALVEEFVDGREFNVSIVTDGAELVVLPPGEIDYAEFPAGAPRLVTFRAKWDPESAEYRGSPSKAADDLSPQLESTLRERALAAFRAIGLAGYGRIDLRLHPERGPLVLDVNPNPDLSPDAGLARAAARGGLRYEQLIERIVRDALGRQAAG